MPFLDREQRLVLVRAALVATTVFGMPAIAAKDSNVRIEQQQAKTFEGRILAFRWGQVNSRELESFTNDLADEYLKLTNTPRFNKEDLVGIGKTNFYTVRSEFVEALKNIDPPHTPLELEWGLSNPASKRVFIDLTTLERYALANKAEAGLALMTALWHEWCHLDLKERNFGVLINSPLEQYHIISNTTKRSEPFNKYHGGYIYSETDYIFHRWDEVLVETITQKRIFEQVGLKQAFLTGNYGQYGTDVLVPFTRSAHISVDTLYKLHATSDV